MESESSLKDEFVKNVLDIKRIVMRVKLKIKGVMFNIPR